jgi:hypothetical protein
MKMTRWIMAVMLCVVTTAFAQNGIRIGDTILHPYVETSAVYDNNVFQNAENLDDAYWEYMGGLRVIHKSDSVAFDSSAWVAQRQYDQYTQKESKRWGAAAVLDVKSDKSSLTTGIDYWKVDEYDDAPRYGSVPTGFEGTVDRAFNRVGSTERRGVANAKIGVGHQLTDDTGLLLGYNYYEMAYSDIAVNDWHEHAVGAEVANRLTDKTFVYVNLQYGLQGGQGAPQDGKTTTFRVGLKNQLTDKSTIRVGIGAVYYESDEESFTEPSFEANALWEPTEKVRLFVDGRNDVQPTQNENGVQLSSRLASGVRYQMLERVGFTLTGAVVHDKAESGAQDETLTSIGSFKVDYTLILGLNLYASVDYMDVDQDAGDGYDRWRGMTGLKYIF